MLDTFRLTEVSSKDSDIDNQVFLAQVHSPAWTDFRCTGVYTFATYITCTGVTVNSGPTEVFKSVTSVFRGHVAMLSFWYIFWKQKETKKQRIRKRKKGNVSGIKQFIYIYINMILTQFVNPGRLFQWTVNYTYTPGLQSSYIVLLSGRNLTVCIRQMVIFVSVYLL